MARWLRSHLGRRSGQRHAWTAFATTLGTAWLVLEPVGLFFPDALNWRWKGYLGLVLVSAIGAVWRSRPRNSVSRALPPTDVVIGLRVGDVLAQNGNVVIGVSDTFDTQFEDGVISPASVQGQLLKRVFDGDRADLDEQISRSLGPVGSEDLGKVFGNRHRYEIGTVGLVRHGRTRFFLPAFTRMSTTLPAHVSSSVSDLQVALAKTWDAVDVAGQREPVHVPVMGSHLARLGLTRTLLIQIIVLSFIASTRRGGPPSLTIWIAPHDRDVVDLTVLDDWLRGLCAA